MAAHVPGADIPGARGGAGAVEVGDGQLAGKDVHVTPSNCVQCGAITAKGGRLTPPRAALGRATSGLVVATTATTRGATSCPYGCGQHPYLSPGAGLIDTCTLEVDARTRILTDNERQLPTGREPVAGTRFDFAAGKPLGDERLDYAFIDLACDDSGRAWVRLSAPDGHCVELWVDEHYPIVELYTGDTLAPERRRRGLGTEPMTWPPNAFQSGDGLVGLQPGQSLTNDVGRPVCRKFLRV